MNFKNLIDAVTLRVGFQIEGPNLVDSEQSRREFWEKQVIDLRINSGFETVAEYRVITMAHIIEAVSIKVWAYLQSQAAYRGVWVVVNPDNNYRLHTYTSKAARYHAEKRAAKETATAWGGATFIARELRAHIATKRAKLVQNIMSKQWVMETTHTPWTSSVQSETYWSA